MRPTVRWSREKLDWWSIDRGYGRSQNHAHHLKSTWKDSNQKRWTFKKRDHFLYFHVEQAKYCKKGSRYPPLCPKRRATSSKNFKNKLQRKKDMSEIQIQMSKLDTISEALLEITWIGIMLLEGRNSMFWRTIFRYLWIILVFGDKRKSSLDLLPDATIDDCWNMDGDTSLPEPWIGVTHIALLNKNPREGCMWVQGRMTKKQVSTRPGNIRPEEWSNTSRGSQRETVHTRAEKTKLDAAREQRCIYFIPDDDLDHEEIVNNARRKSDLCKVTTPADPSGSRWSDFVQVHGLRKGWILHFSKQDYEDMIVGSQVVRITKSTEKTHKDHVADRGHVSMAHCTMDSSQARSFCYFVHSLPKAAFGTGFVIAFCMEIGLCTKVTSEAEVIRRAQWVGKTVHFATWWTCVISGTPSLRKVLKVQRKSRVERWYCGRRVQVRCVCGARCFSVTFYCGRSPGREFKITRLFWTSKWCRERIHTSRNERRSGTSSSFGRGMSEDLDQNTESKETTQLRLNWRSSGTGGAQSLESSTGWFLVGKKMREILAWRRMGWSPWMGVPTRSSQNAIILVSGCWRHGDGRESLNTCRRCGAKLQKASRFGRYILDVLGEQHNSVTELCQNRRDKSQRHLSLELWHGRSRSEVCWRRLRIGAQDGWPTPEGFHILFGR